MSFRYTVSAQFEADDVAEEWIEWLKNGHCRAVLEGGATRVEVIRLDPEESRQFEARYDFPSRGDFAQYQKEYAPQLIAEGLERFPTSRGIQYARSMGLVLHAEG